MLMSIALVAAMSAPAAAPKVVVVDFKAVKLSRKVSAAASDHFAKKLGEQGVEVIAPMEAQGMLPVSKKRLLSCAEKKPKCAAQLAEALGAGAVCMGSVGKSGKAFQVKVKVISAETAKPVFLYAKLVREEKDIDEALNTAAQRLGQKLGATPPKPEPATTPVATTTPETKTTPPAETTPPVNTTTPAETTTVAATTPAKPPEPEVEDVLAPVPTLKRRHHSRGFVWQPWAVTGVGAAATAVGVIFLVQANAAWINLTGTPNRELTPSQADQAATSGASNRTIGAILTGAGLAVAAAGVAWIAMEPDWRLVSFVPTSDGFAFSLSGRW